MRAETAEPSEEGVQAAEQGHTARGGPGLVSAREARDLQQLLDMFSMGYSDVEDFQARLDSELGALEVGSCCGSTGFFIGVLGDFHAAAGLGSGCAGGGKLSWREAPAVVGPAGAMVMQLPACVGRFGGVRNHGDRGSEGQDRGLQLHRQHSRCTQALHVPSHVRACAHVPPAAVNCHCLLVLRCRQPTCMRYWRAARRRLWSGTPSAEPRVCLKTLRCSPDPFPCEPLLHRDCGASLPTNLLRSSPAIV